jgi:predicted ATPase
MFRFGSFGSRTRRIGTAPMTHEPFLKYVTLVTDRVWSFDNYPFSIPAVRHLGQLDLNPSLTIFAGENGTGKSTLLEAIAVLEGLNLEGGSRNFCFSTRQVPCELADALRLGRGAKRLNKSDAFFLRAESFFNVATEADRLGVAYDSRSLHDQSHGESFLALLTNRFRGNGLYLLDEPEAALSPTRQLSLLRIIHDLCAQGSQFIVATHSPIIMGYPDASIYWFSTANLELIKYEDTEHYKVTKSFLIARDRILRELFA